MAVKWLLLCVEKKHKLQMFKNKTLRKIIRPIRDELSGGYCTVIYLRNQALSEQ
jgi:hypothetical protein